MVKGFHTADNIIKEALVEIGDFELMRYKEAAMYFMKGYRDFKLFKEEGNIKEAWRPVTAINTVNFPEDLLRFIAVGVLIDSEFFSFTRADKLRTPSDPIDEQLNDDREEDETMWRAPSYGYGTKANNLEYYYKEDRANRRIVLSRMALDKTLFADRTEVLFRYVSNGLDDGLTTLIPDDAANLLSAFIVYKLVASRPDKNSLGYIAFRKDEYIEKEREYHALELPTLQELEDMLYETSSQNIRRD